MQYLLTLCVSLLLVSGQGMWKYGIGQLLTNTGHVPLVKRLLQFGLNPYILLGCVIYVVATVLYMYVIGRYEYAVSYTMIVSFSVILASTTAVFFFQEKLTPVNMVGIAVVLFGVALIIKR